MEETYHSPHFACEKSKIGTLFCLVYSLVGEPMVASAHPIQPTVHIHTDHRDCTEPAAQRAQKWFL